MSTVSTGLLARQEADLLSQLLEVLARHPAGRFFHLLVADGTVPVGPGEVLVQVADLDRGVIELRPRKAADIQVGDVLHDTRRVSIADPAFVDYAQTPMDPKYVKDATTGQHIVVMGVTAPGER
jgi:hypothetical protein